MLIGFNLAPVVAGVHWPQNPGVAMLVMIFTIVAAVAFRGSWSRIAIFLALIFGFLFVLGARRHRRRDHRAHRACQGGPGSHSDDVISYMGRALFADGLGTALFSAIGGSPTTTYAENIGMMAATRVYSTAAAYYVAALVAILLGLVPKVRRGGQRHPGRRARRDHRRALRHDRPAGRQDLDRQQGQLSQSGQPGADRRRRDRDQLRQVGWPARSRRSGRNRTG